MLIAAGLFFASRAPSLHAIYLTYGLGVGIGVGFVYVPAIGTVQRWFEKYRGFASGLAVAGIGVGTLVIPPFATLLIDWGGWRNAYAILAGVAVVLGLIAAALLDHSPERRGLYRDGITPSIGTDIRNVSGGFTLREALRSRPFWLLYASGASTAFGIFIPFVHLAPYVVDHGMTEAFGVTLVGLIGVGSVAGRFVLGGTADRIGRRVGVGLMFAGMAAMLLLWLFATDPIPLAVFALVFGICYGGYVALVPALTTDYFGGRNASSIIGFLYTSAAFGTLFGPTLAGLAFDLSGSYVWPIVAAAVANLVGVACVMVIPDPDRFRATKMSSIASRA